MFAIIARGAAEMATEFASEVALIGKAAAECHLGQGLAGVDQGPAGHAHLEFPQIFLGREVKAAAEFPLEGPDRHVRQPGQLPIGDRRVVMIPNVGQDLRRTRTPGRSPAGACPAFG